jgi:hypothetical protein
MRPSGLGQTGQSNCRCLARRFVEDVEALATSDTL